MFVSFILLVVLGAALFVADARDRSPGAAGRGRPGEPTGASAAATTRRRSPAPAPAPAPAAPAGTGAGDGAAAPASPTPSAGRRGSRLRRRRRRRRRRPRPAATVPRPTTLRRLRHARLPPRRANDARRPGSACRPRTGARREETLPAGEMREWIVERPFVITIGNAGGVSLELNGRALPPLGAQRRGDPRLVLPARTAPDRGATR